MSYNYKSKHSYEYRLAESRKIRETFPGRIPVIIEKAARSGEIPTVDKNKFLVPADLTVGQFIYVVRKRLAMPPEKALFLFINNSLPPTGVLMRELYAQYADEDGFLYSSYGGENTFGCVNTSKGYIKNQAEPDSGVNTFGG
jgi:GABA(A) receptor-associated protein